MGFWNTAVLAGQQFLDDTVGKRLSLNREKKGEIDVYPVSYIFNVARKPASVVELRSEVLKSPEIISRILTITDDVLPGYDVVCEDDAQREKVMLTLEKNEFFKKLHSAYIDSLITGDGYLEPVFVKEKDIELLLSNLTNGNIYKGILSHKDKDLIKKQILKQNPEMYEPTQISWLMCNNIYKQYDKHGTNTGYKQIIHGQIKASWGPDDLINISNYNINSEVYGFTPLLSYLDDLVTLKNTKTHVNNFFENNGVPDTIISLKNSGGPKDPAFLKLQEMMRERREKKMRGSLVTSGELVVEELTKNKDMDFQMLLDYLQSNIDLIWRIPPQKLRGTSSKTRDANAVLRPYYARIKKEQKFIEDLLNAKFFKHFGKEGTVRIKLLNSSSVDQVTDVNWNTVMYHDGVISPSEYRSAMGKSEILPNDLEENPFYKQQKAMAENPMGINQNPNSDPNKGKLTDNKVNPNKTPKQQAGQKK